MIIQDSEDSFFKRRLRRLTIELIVSPVTESLTAVIFRLLSDIERKIMGKVDDIAVALNDLRDHVSSETAQVSGKLDALTTEIEALKAKIAAGAASADQVDAILAQIATIKGDVDGIVTEDESAGAQG